MSLHIKQLWLLLSLFLLMTVVAKAQTDNFFEEEKIPMVVLSALDKITTQLSTIKIKQNQMVRFGTLEITLRHCRTSPPEETPETMAFLEIIDVGYNKQNEKVFSGWMFASSPALSPLEHPVYDVWVKDCKMVSGIESSGNE